MATADDILRGFESPDPQVRAQACLLAAEQGVPGALGALAERVRDPEAVVRHAACASLGELEDPRGVEPLLAAFADPEDEVRAAATAALIRIGAARAEAAPTELLTGDGQAGDAQTRLHWVTDLDAIDLLRTTLRTGSDDARIAAAYALGSLEAVVAVESLMLALGDDLPEVRSAAAFSLGQLRPSQAVDVLMDALGDDDVGVELNVLSALAAIGARKAEKAFLQAASGDDEELRGVAAAGLGKLALDAGTSAVALSALGALSRDKGTSVRWAAAVALGRVVAADAPPAEAASETLCDLLADPAQRVREAAAGALKKRGRGVGALLRDRIGASSPAARRGAAYGLGRLGGPEAAQLLRGAAIGDADQKVRAAAAIALADRALTEASSQPVARRTLMELLTDRTWSLRAAGVEGLRRIADPTTVEALRKAAADPHPAVRQAVEMALRVFEQRGRS